MGSQKSAENRKGDLNLSKENTNALNNKISVYPNPAQDFVTINGLSGQNGIKIRNVFGKIVKSLKVASNEITIRIANVPTGIYFIEIIGENKRVSKKMVVE